MAAPLTNTEAHLATAIVLWLADAMTTDLSGQWSDDSNRLYDLGQSNYEAGCSTLASLGVFGQDGPKNWRPLVRAKAIGAHLAAQNLRRTALDRLLDALIIHGAGHLQTFQRPIPPPKTEQVTLLDDVCICLFAAGYMTKNAQGWYILTPQIGPWMAARGLSPLADFAPCTAVRAKADIAAMPTRLHNLLANPNLLRSQPDFLRLIAQHKTASGWSAEPRHGTFPSDTWDMPLLAGMFVALNAASKNA